jgi:YVTN family beta-propeller protein
MGIGDYGVKPLNGAWVAFMNTSSGYQGTDHIVNVSAANGGNTAISIQLNVPYVLTGVHIGNDPNIPYAARTPVVYWVQDIAEINTTTRVIQFVDNIMNFTDGGVAVTGCNGKGGYVSHHDTYVYWAPNGLPGNDRVLTYPTNISLRMTSSNQTNGVTISLAYSDALSGGWQTYDNFTILWSHSPGWQNTGFVVNGGNVTPEGWVFNYSTRQWVENISSTNYYDAELTYGGNYNANDTTNRAGTDMIFELDSFNGYNFEAVPYAWNFGEDTAEDVDLLTEGLGDTQSGAPVGLLSGTTSTTFGPLYSLGQSQYAYLNATTSLTGGGTLLVNGAPIQYAHNQVNLLLATGSYKLVLEEHNVTRLSRNVTLGETGLSISFPAPSLGVLPGAQVAGGALTLTGSNLASNALIPISIQYFGNNLTQTTCRSNSAGNFTNCRVTLGPIPGGMRQVVATFGGITVTSPVQVESAITLDNVTSYIPAGYLPSDITVNGTGFAPLSQIVFTFDGSGVYSSCLTNSVGSFPGNSWAPCTFQIPWDSDGFKAVKASDGVRTANATYLIDGCWVCVVASTEVGLQPTGLVVDTDTDQVFVSNYLAGTVSVINAATNNIVATIPVGLGPMGMTYDSCKGYIYVTDYLGASVTVISAANDMAVTTVGVGLGPDAAAFDSTNCQTFVSNSMGGSVSVIGDADNEVIHTIPVGNGPDGISYVSGLSDMFVANYGDGTVSVITDSTDIVVGTIVVGSGPVGVAYDPEMSLVYVCNSQGGTISEIALTGGFSVTTIQVGGGPYGIVYDAALDYMFVSETTNGTIAVIEDSSGQLLGGVPTGSGAGGIGYDSTNGMVYVASEGQGTVLVLTT